LIEAEIQARGGRLMANAKVQVRRAYEDLAQGDGTRVPVDRIWPRRLTKATAALYEWAKEIAPSTELRKGYGHDAERFEEFGRRYQAELQSLNVPAHWPTWGSLRRAGE
jgi:uncharacterized protein YeaO (DUF488 family)